MTYLIVYGGAYALWITLIIEGCRNTTHLCRQIIHPVIDLLGGDTFFDVLSYIVQHRDVDLGALADACDLILIFDDGVVRYQMSCILDTLDLFVHSHVALLIFLAALAPARVIASDTDLLSYGPQIHLVSLHVHFACLLCLPVV